MARKKRGDHILIPALARGETIARAANAAGITERTVYRRLADPDFKSRVETMRASLMDQATGKLVAGADQAIDTLLKLLKAKSESVRCQAARALLDHLLRLRELSEFEGRLRRIEDRLDEMQALQSRLF